MNSLVSQMIEAIGSFWSRMMRFFVNEPAKVVAALVILFFVVAGIQIYVQFFSNNFVIYSGPRGSAGYQYGESISSGFSESENKWYKISNIRTIKSVPTDGFEANRQAIAEDRSGKAIGFAHDGFGKTENVRILLPLDKTYLHIICSRPFFQSLNERCEQCGPDNGDAVAPVPSPEPPVRQKKSGGLLNFSSYNFFSSESKTPPEFTMHVLAESLKSARTRDVRKRNKKYATPRIALGPKESGTRQVASKTLEHFGLAENIHYEDYRVSSWIEAFNSMGREGGVDILFFLGPINSDLVRSVANRNVGFLIGLSDDAGGIAAALESVNTASFVPHQYGRNIVTRFEHDTTIEINDEKYPAPVEFCPNEITVLQTRRVLICSKWMSRKDGYFLANLARDSLSEKVPIVDWSNDPNKKTTEKFSFLFHPSTDDIRSGARQTGFDFFLKSIAPSFLISFVIALASVLVGQLNRYFGERQKIDQLSNTSAFLTGQIFQTESELDSTHKGILSRSKRKLIESRMDALESRIDAEKENLAEVEVKSFLEQIKTIRKRLETEFVTRSNSYIKFKRLIGDLAMDARIAVEISELDRRKLANITSAIEQLANDDEITSAEKDVLRMQLARVNALFEKRANESVFKNSKYFELHATIEQWLSQIKILPPKLAQHLFDEWEQKIHLLSERIERFHRNSEITKDEHESLLNALKEVRQAFGECETYSKQYYSFSSQIKFLENTIRFERERPTKTRKTQIANSIAKMNQEMTQAFANGDLDQVELQNLTAELADVQQLHEQEAGVS